MRKWLIGLIAGCIACGLIAGAALWYIAPREELDLRYAEVPIMDRALAMVRNLSLQLELTEADVNNYAKAALAQGLGDQQGAVVTGADFRFINGRLEALINVKYRELIPAALKLTYRLEWKEPNLVATVERASIRAVSLPTDRFERMVIPIGQELPKPLRISSISIADRKLVLQFRKPSLPDFRGLL